MEAFNTTTTNMKQQPKIKTLQFYTKIQEGRPAHHSNLVNKELGYDCIIDMVNNQQQIKIKNCISSARSNSQLFKRISCSLISNISNSIDQLYLFVSANPSTRLQTSIGLSTNPGLFLIVGLTYLDQKYKQAYQKCDVQFSFIQFRQGQMYDLLCYTGQPLTEKRECCTNKLANFGQHWARTTTFNQFIKVFKIALFNNKERDFSSRATTQKLKSTFIMKVRNKLYNEVGELIKQSETALVDFQPNCVKQSSQGAKQKNGSKSLLDYILIECHNSNPGNKNIHYHLVQQNNLLVLIKKYLHKSKDFRTIQTNNDQKDLPTVGGQLTIINSLPAIKQSFNLHYSFLQHINSYISQPFEVKVEDKSKKNIQFNYLFLYNQLNRILKTITNNTYSSLRNFDQFKRLLVCEAKKCKTTIKKLRKVINTAMKQKLELIFLKNQFLGHQMKLVGSCIKSDHFKDFYKAKSYLLLQREVGIKTQQINEQIKLKAKDLDENESKFYLMKKRESQKYDKFRQEEDRKKLNVVDSNLQPGNTLSNFSVGKTFATVLKQHKFKPLGSSQAANINQMQLLKYLTNFLSKHMYAFWDNYVLFDPRTTAQILQFQNNIIKQENQLYQALDNFTQSVNSINQTDILYEQQNNLYNNNQIALFRSFNFLGVIGPQKNVKGYNVGKRIVIKSNQLSTKTKFSKMIGSEKNKLTLIKPIIIKPDLRISDFLLKPKECLFSTNPKQKIVEESAQEPKTIA